MDSVSENLWLRRKPIDYIQDYDVLDLRDLNKYEKLKQIGKGSFGVVFKAVEKTNSQNIVAIKELIMCDTNIGFSKKVLREIEILQHMNHPNIIRLVELCKKIPDTRPSICLILEYCKYDLSGLLRNPHFNIRLPEVKYIMSELLQGVSFLHSNNVLHRDLKPSNILVTTTGDVKIGDFGLSRYASNNSMSNMIITRWYRPPELLLGRRNYSFEVDIWSVGCVFAELYTRHPILKAITDYDQFILINNLCGSITARVWPEAEALPLYRTFKLPVNMPCQIKTTFPMIDSSGIELLKSLINLNPSKRISAEEALNHVFFHGSPVEVNFKNRLARLRTLKLRNLCII